MWPFVNLSHTSRLCTSLFNFFCLLITETWKSVVVNFDTVYIISMGTLGISFAWNIALQTPIRFTNRLRKQPCHFWIVMEPEHGSFSPLALHFFIPVLARSSSRYDSQCREKRRQPHWQSLSWCSISLFSFIHSWRVAKGISTRTTSILSFWRFADVSRTSLAAK